MSILNKLKAVLFFCLLCPQKLLHILKLYTPYGWMNSYQYSHTYTTHIYIYLIGFIFYSLFAHIYSFFIFVCLLACSLLFSLFSHFTAPYTMNVNLYFSQSVFFLFPASFTISSRCGSTHKWLQCIKVSKVKVWSCHDTTRKYNEWGKWHISARNAHALTHE